MSFNPRLKWTKYVSDSRKQGVADEAPVALKLGVNSKAGSAMYEPWDAAPLWAWSEKQGFYTQDNMKNV